MALINYLVYLLKIFGLILVLGILFNLILDVVIIQPIQNRILRGKQVKLFKTLMKKIENGEEISKTDLDLIKEKIEE